MNRQAHRPCNAPPATSEPSSIDADGQASSDTPLLVPTRASEEVPMVFRLSSSSCSPLLVNYIVMFRYFNQFFRAVLKQKTNSVLGDSRISLEPKSSWATSSRSRPGRAQLLLRQRLNNRLSVSAEISPSRFRPPIAKAPCVCRLEKKASTSMHSVTRGISY